MATPSNSYNVQLNTNITQYFDNIPTINEEFLAFMVVDVYEEGDNEYYFSDSYKSNLTFTVVNDTNKYITYSLPQSYNYQVDGYKYNTSANNVTLVTLTVEEIITNYYTEGSDTIYLPSIELYYKSAFQTANIKYLKDENNETFSPVTSTSSVYTNTRYNTRKYNAK